MKNSCGQNFYSATSGIWKEARAKKKQKRRLRQGSPFRTVLRFKLCESVMSFLFRHSRNWIRRYKSKEDVATAAPFWAFAGAKCNLKSELEKVGKFVQIRVKSFALTVLSLSRRCPECSCFVFSICLLLRGLSAPLSVGVVLNSNDVIMTHANI
jgi:hypothetical protein